MPKYRPETNNIEGALVRDIPIDRIDPFPDHPFKVTDDEYMAELIESIRVRGQLTLALVRKQYHGRYELISGHRRLYACRKLGMETLRCEVTEMTKEEAVIAMVESNFHRPRILPSEKAFAYKMRLEAMKMQVSRLRDSQRRGMKVNGKPAEAQIDAASSNLIRSYGLTVEEVEKIGTPVSRRGENYRRRHHIEKVAGAPVVPETNRVRDKLAAISPDSREQIRRYIRLTELIPELLDLVDEGKIGLRTAVELSYLGLRQKDVYECMQEYQCVPTQAQALRMKKLHADNALTYNEIEEILAEQKPNQEERIVLHGERFQKLMPEHLHKREYEDYIAEAISHYNSYIRKKNLARAGD